jgi:hypothetical protein
VRLRVIATLVALVGLVAGCPDSKKRPPPRGNGTAVDRPGEVAPPPTKQRHSGHEHYHGQHPHGGNVHHHHGHPHPHLAGQNNHHHPY